MIYAIIIAIIIIVLLSFFNKEFYSFFPKSSGEIHDAELVKTLLNLNEKSLNELLELYENEFGANAAKYARRTFKKWRAGEVRPNRQTFNRFLVYLPKVMSYELKCAVLRRLMEQYCSRKDYQINVFTDDWEQTLAPLVEEIIAKPYTAELPAPIAEKLNWLADGEMQIARNILRQSQVEESRIAVSMLRQEFQNIEKLLVETRGKSKVTHRLKFPYGTITLKIERR